LTLVDADGHAHAVPRGLLARARLVPDLKFRR
jgi:hypothetical protein